MSKPVSVMVLEDAYALIEDEQYWTHRKYSEERRIGGKWLGRNIVARCADAAIEAAAVKYGGTSAEMARSRFYQHMGWTGFRRTRESIWAWNDSTSRQHHEVLEAFRDAIKS